VGPLGGCSSCPAPPFTGVAADPTGLGGSPEGGTSVTTHAGKQAPEFSPIPIVFNLCSDSTGKQFLEEYSGYSGFHIRTVPGERWRNPQFVAAANQWVAVIDRFADFDMVRVTDKYAGATVDGFDEDGFPLPGVNWPELEDLYSLSLPTGYRATGVCVVERGTMLINLSDGSGSTYVYKWQPGTTDPNLTDLIELGSFGDTLGSPAGLFSRPGDQLHLGLSLVQRGSYYAVALYNWLREKPVAFLGLPDDHTPLAVGEGNNVIAVLTESAGTRYIIRFPFNAKTGVMNGAVRGDELPGPEDYAVTKSFQPFDPGFIVTDLELFSEYTEEAHKRLARIDEYPTPTASESEELAEGGRNLSGTTQTHNDDREQSFTELNSTYYGAGVVLRYNVIENPATSTILGLCGGFGAVCETLRSLSDGAIDPQEPIFRVVDAKTHSFLSNGGFVYGCPPSSGDTTETTGVTSGYEPGSIAIDVGYERGSLKDLADLKVAIIDAQTGYLWWQPVKPYTDDDGNPYKIYSGSYAGLSVPSGSSIQDSQCSDAFGDYAEAIDGITRPGHTSPGTDPEPAQFSVDFEDLDSPWAFFKRRAIMGNSPILAPALKSFSIRMSDGIVLLPEHRDAVGICRETSKTKIFWPPVSAGVSEPIFSVSNRSGFFVPNFTQERTTSHAVLREQIDDAQAQISAGGLTDAQIEALQTQIAGWEEDLATTDDETVYRTSPSTLALRFPRMEASEAQALTDPVVTGDYDQSDQIEIPPVQSVDPVPLTPWTVLPLEGTDQRGETADLRRGIVMDTNIRSWIGIDIKLDRGGLLTDGDESYINPAHYSNGLGVNVGGNAYDADEDSINGSCHAAAFSYEAGYFAGDGANGVWEFDIIANGVPIDSIATRVFSLEEITGLAPSEGQDTLYASLSASGGVGINGMREGRVYYSSEVIEAVTIRARLINYAYGVFRVGYRTVHRRDSGPYYTTGLCPGMDPGFNSGITCESCCGNITCTSFIFFGNKLFADDPIIPRTRQIVWQGEATFAVNADPYRDNLNVGLGRLIDAYMEFNLVEPISSYNIDISQNT
jgi:hypothetical protein